MYALVKVTITSDNGVEMNMMSADSNPAMMIPEAMSDGSMMATQDAIMSNNLMATPEATTSMGG